MRPIPAAFGAALLLLSACRSGPTPGGGGVTHPVSSGAAPDATVTFAVNGSGAVTLRCRPECTGPNSDTLTVGTNKNVQFTAPGGNLAVLTFEQKNNSDELPFDSNPATVVFYKSAVFNTRHTLPPGAVSQPYYYHLFLFDPATRSAHYRDPLIIIGR